MANRYNMRVISFALLATLFAGVFYWFAQDGERIRPLTIEEQEVLVSVLDRLPEEIDRDVWIARWEKLFASSHFKVYSGLRKSHAVFQTEDGDLAVTQSFFEADPVQQEQTLLDWIRSHRSL